MLVFDINVSHGSVATRLRCGGMSHNDFIANLPLSVSVKKFWKSVNIWRSYRQKYSGMFFWLTVYVDGNVCASVELPSYTSFYDDDDANNVLADDNDARYQPVFRLDKCVYLLRPTY